MREQHIVIVSQIPMWSMGKDIGGPAFRETVTALGRRFRVTLVAPRVDYVDAADLPSGVTLAAFDHRLHGTAREVRKIGWLFDAAGYFAFQRAAWRTVRDLCRTGDVDLLYGYEIYGVPVVRRAATLFSIPMVARYQGTLMSWRRHETLAGLRYFKHLRALRTPADLYIVTNDGTRAAATLVELGAESSRVRDWMNGVDRSILEAPAGDVRGELGIAQDRPMLLTVSRLQWWKRVDRAVAAHAELVRRGNDVDLVIVGTGPKESALRAQVADAGTDDRVHFVGSVPREGLAAYYRAADLLLSLYDYSNLGNPAMESMLLGTPVVALDVGDTSDLVADGANGRLVASAEAGAVADTVSEIIGDPTELADLSERARAWAAKHLWPWDERMAVEIAALESLLGD